MADIAVIVRGDVQLETTAERTTPELRLVVKVASCVEAEVATNGRPVTNGGSRYRQDGLRK